MPLLLAVSCFSKIQIGFTFLVPAHLGSPGERAVKWVCVCVCALLCENVTSSTKTDVNNILKSEKDEHSATTTTNVLKTLLGLDMWFT